MNVFGLTGGIGTGKSFVASLWRDRGLPVLDADQLSREVVALGSPGLEALTRAFGSDIVANDGSLSRGALAAMVFRDEKVRLLVESIIHPLVRDAASKRFERFAEQGEPLACYEVPLLFEVELDAELRPIVVVTSDEASQLQRVLRRDGATLEQVKARVAAQLPLATKAERADYVIDNSGSPESTAEQASRVLIRICEAFAIPPHRYLL